MGKKLTTLEFIERAIQVHGSTYDYSLTEYVNADAKVEIVCLVHGSFFQRPADHTRGSGCALCHERQQLTSQQFTDRATHLHQLKYTYEQAIYKNVTTKVDITCPLHGIFRQTPKDHLNGYGCPVCGGTKKKCNADFIASAKEIHGDKYSYSRVDLKSMNKKVEIVCPDHGNFFQRPADHVNGSGCPVCSLMVRGKYSLQYFETFPTEKHAPAMLYLVSVDDKFCKIGITKQTIAQRFTNKPISEVLTVSMNLYDAYIKEQEILMQYAHQRYRTVGVTSRQFAGWTECFPLSLLPELKEAMENING